MFRHTISICLLATLSLTGCNEFQQAVQDAKKPTTAPPKDNYIVLLDLSDRILQNNQQQVAKDLTVVNSIYTAFKVKLAEKDPTHLYYTVTDKLKVLIAPQKSTPKSLYDEVGTLRVELASEQPEKRAAAIDGAEKTFQTTLPDIYKQAVISNNSKAYSGADIWKYFNEDLQDDLDKGARNTLFIVTDGYMNFESASDKTVQNNRFTSCSQLIAKLKKNADWTSRFDADDYGLLPTGKKFSNLQVVLLEVDPRQDWNEEYNVLQKIWGKWFAEMGISNYHFVKNDNINEIKESLEKIMQVRLAGTLKPLQWQMVTDIDSNLAAAQTEALKDVATMNSPASKKKDSEVANNDTSDIHRKTANNPPAKTITKPKQQVSFGPVY
ncbi:MAG: hypothetical protein QM731_19335 [Chitinophagaceae bacterium]